MVATALQRCVPSPPCRNAPFRGGRLPRSWHATAPREWHYAVAAAHCAWCRAGTHRARGRRDSRQAEPWRLPSSTAAPSRPRGARGHGRGAPGQRPAELHAGRAGRHRGQGVARARARRAADTAASSSRTTSGSPSTWRRPTCRRNPAASTCRSRSASSPRAGRSTPARLARLRVRRRAVAGRRAAPGARCAGDGAGAAARASAERARTLVLPLASARRGGARSTASRSAAPRHLLDVVRALLPGEAADAARAARRACRSRRVAAAALPDLRDVQGPGRRQARARDRRGRRRTAC